MKVNIVSPVSADQSKITKALTYQREGSDSGRLICVPLGLANVHENLFPARVAYKRGTSEVKNGRRRILVEDTIPVYLQYEVGSSAELLGTPVEASRVNIKIHTVLELPWTTPVIAGTSSTLSPGMMVRNKALAAALKIHAMNFIPNLGTTWTGTVNSSTGDGTGALGLVGTEDEYLNSPFVRGSYDLPPFGEDSELGTEDTTVE